MYTAIKNPNKERIAGMYGARLSKADELIFNGLLNDGITGLTRAEELGILSFDGQDILKGRIAMPIGSHATWGGISYLKTASGWKPVGKHRGQVKANHDHIHNNEDKDKDHHTMTMDAGKMSAEEWTAKHGTNLHSKYKEVYDYLFAPKQVKEIEVTGEQLEKKLPATISPEPMHYGSAPRLTIKVMARPL